MLTYPENFDDIKSEIRYYFGSKYNDVNITNNLLFERQNIGESLIEDMKDIPIINGDEDVDFYQSNLYHFYQVWFEE